MLLHKISLKGFLSYYGQETADGSINPVVIDFRRSPLWLINGHNGTGKSSLFDAITFALYGEHRGGKNGAKNLIHDRANKAQIELEIELEGKTYLIQRTITRKNRGKSVENWGIVRDLSAPKHPAIPNTENKVTNWVEERLKISYETFVSCVLLRQGEADIFLKAQPKKRKECLMSLLDLEFYKNLGDRAREELNKYKQESDRIEQELGNIEPITEDDIQEQQETIDKIEGLLTCLRERQADVNQQLENAREVIDYRKRIEVKRKQQESDRAILDREPIIKSNIQRYRELQRAIELLNSLWRERERLSAEEEKIQVTDEALETQKITLEMIQLDLESASREKEAIEESSELLDRLIEEFQQCHHSLEKEGNDLKQVKKLEQLIEEEKERLVPYEVLLRDADEIERNYWRYRELDRAVPLLGNLRSCQEKLLGIEQQLIELQESEKHSRQRIATIKLEKQDIEKRIHSLYGEIDCIQEKLQNKKSRLSILVEKLQYRKEISHASECPTCGSHLDDPDVQRRLQQEERSWQEEVTALQQEQVSLEEFLTIKNGEKNTIDFQLRELAEQISRLEIELAVIQTNQRSTENSRNELHRSISQYREETGIWLSQLEQLSELELELQKLAGVSQQQEKLKNARITENIVKERVEKFQVEIDRLPYFSESERLQLDFERAEIMQLLEEAEEEKRDIVTAYEEIISRINQLELNKSNEETRITSLEEKLQELEERKQQHEREIEEGKNHLSEEWQNHPACKNKRSLDKLIRERDHLSDAEKHERELQEARERISKLAGEIETLQTSLDNIPIEHYRPVSEVQSELEEIECSIREEDQKLNTERQKLGAMNARKERFNKLEAQQKEVEREYGYYKDLAEAFGKKGLQARIIQEAQEKIKLNANRTLQHLSNGRWQIDLQGNDDDLNIVAKDLSQAETPTRQFEYLSGGEKFIVSVSIAVAIGQSIAGGRTVNTLIIDEGFGSLDDEKRPLMVNEIRRLSSDILSGGRVIIVSHQEDVLEEFDHRYRVYRDSNTKYTRVERIVSGEVDSV